MTLFSLQMKQCFERSRKRTPEQAGKRSFRKGSNFISCFNLSHYTKKGACRPGGVRGSCPELVPCAARRYVSSGFASAVCVCVWSGRSVVGNGGPSETEMNNGIDGRGFLDVCACASSNIKAELHGHGLFFVSALVVDVSRKMVISAQRSVEGQLVDWTLNSGILGWTES